MKEKESYFTGNVVLMAVILLIVVGLYVFGKISNQPSQTEPVQVEQTK